MKQSTNVPLTKAQRKALLIAANDFIMSSADGGAPLRNAIKRLKKVRDAEDAPATTGAPDGSIIGAAASGADNITRPAND